MTKVGFIGTGSGNAMVRRDRITAEVREGSFPDIRQEFLPRPVLGANRP